MIIFLRKNHYKLFSNYSISFYSEQ
ncbi:hypothetical protein J2S01_002084 [Pectinatus haikarae]|uniref:Photosystem II protein I n=1 Tax=Pectinatus haikarae TaxID=349096 RepID=A0ABT9Y9E8_9FIRM|nr:hypothetical protein [Pectinatus haikarae]